MDSRSISKWLLREKKKKKADGAQKHLRTHTLDALGRRSGKEKSIHKGG